MTDLDGRLESLERKVEEEQQALLPLRVRPPPLLLQARPPAWGVRHCGCKHGTNYLQQQAFANV